MSSLDMGLIFNEILPRLPVKSQIRFKCVSKSFKSEISSRNFSQLYLRYQSLSLEDDVLVLLGEKGIMCYDLDFTSSFSTYKSTFNWNGCIVRVVGSCNGLLCIVAYSDDKHFLVLNPTTRICQDIHLPVNDQSTGKIGFAFDPVNRDYKVVSLSTELNTLITKVYSLNANSWKILEFPYGDDMNMIGGFDSGILINNNLLHWTYFIPSGSRQRIGCFDVCKNEWIDDVLFPHYFYDPHRSNYLWDIAVINDNLCSTFENRDDSCYEVWMMNEYGVQDSWLKLLSIQESSFFSSTEPPVPFKTIACNRRSGRLLIQMRFTHIFLWWDSSSGRRIEVTFEGADDSDLAFICKRSLVHLPDGHLFPDP